MNHGGKREGAGRKAGTKGLNFPISIRVTKDAYYILKTVVNKSEYIDKLIKRDRL